MRRSLTIAGLIVLTALAAACNRGEDPSAETTLTSIGGTDVNEGTVIISAPSSTTEPADQTSTVATTIAVVIGMPTYEVVAEIDAGSDSTLIVVVEPGSYSNVELQNLVFDVVDRFAPTTATLVDDSEAADLLLLEELTEEQEAYVAEHTFIRITNGVEVTFLGPYSDIPGLMIGS